MNEDGHTPSDEEDFLPPDYLEIEQVLACDESKMDPKVFSRQRAFNLQRALFEVEEHNQEKKMTTVDLGKGSLGRNKCGSISENIYQSDESWGPEDYVCHVVKWKGMQSSEVTWNYCKDIKQDYVDESE